MPGQILTELPDHYQPQFQNNWEFLLSQKDSRFENAVSMVTVKGSRRRISQLDDDGAMREVTTRNGQTVPQDTDTAIRWVSVRGYDAVTWIDEWDEISLGELPTPQSEHVVSHARKAKRTKDDIIIAAMEGTNYTGTDGTTPVTVPSGQQVAVNYVRSGSPANSGMTLAKWIRAKRIMDDNEVPDENRYIAFRAAQIEDLLADVQQVSSGDYANVKALVDGKLDRFLGFNVIRSQRLTVNSGTDVATCIAWHKDYVVYGVGQTEKARIDILPTQNHSIQIRTTLVGGASRKQEEGVVLIYCDQSP